MMKEWTDTILGISFSPIHVFPQTLIHVCISVYIGNTGMGEVDIPSLVSALFSCISATVLE